MDLNNFLLIGKDKNDNRIFLEDLFQCFLLSSHGSGKGVAFLIPNLLTQKGSMIVHDVKSELYKMTHKVREKMGQKVFYWNPLNKKSHRYNPLDFISKEVDQALHDLQQFVKIFIQDEEKNSIEARELLIVLLFYQLNCMEKQTSLGEIAKLVFGDFTKKLQFILDHKTHHEELHSTQHVKQTISTFLQKDPKTQNKITAILKNHLSIFLNPIIDFLTSASDFLIEDLYNEKMTLYIGVDPSNMIYLQPLMRFFYDYLIFRLMKYNQVSNYDIKEKSSICIMLDEFYSLGKLQLLQSSMPYFRGCKIQLLLITHNLSQLEKVYQNDGLNDILSNCYYKIIFKSADIDTAIKISEECNLDLQDLLKLKGNEEIICHNLNHHTIAYKCCYYDDKEMVNMLPSQVNEK